eukprot:34957-Rhodomonas_salina.2
MILARGKGRQVGTRVGTCEQLEYRVPGHGYPGRSTNFPPVPCSRVQALEFEYAPTSENSCCAVRAVPGYCY